jgi:hypothetical protein
MISWPGIGGEKINFAGPLPKAVLSITRTVTMLFEEGILRPGRGFGAATKSAEAMTGRIAGGIVGRPGSHLTDLLFEGSSFGYMGYSVIEVPEGEVLIFPSFVNMKTFGRDALLQLRTDEGQRLEEYSISECTVHIR